MGLEGWVGMLGEGLAMGVLYMDLGLELRKHQRRTREKPIKN